MTVASLPAVAARWLADGRLRKPGVWAPEQVVDGRAFFADLAERGIVSSLSREEVVAG